MGYGEFGGNGSVIWQVQHGDGEHGGGNASRCVGKDREPARGSGGRFVVLVNGIQLANVDLDSSRIVIAWGRHTLEDVPGGTKNLPMAEPAAAV